MSSPCIFQTGTNFTEPCCRRRQNAAILIQSWFRTLLIALLTLVCLARAGSVEFSGAAVECSVDEAHIVVKLVASELAKGAGWTLNDKNGAEIMGQSGGYGKRTKPTPYSYSTCVSRSDCGGDGGDGKLTLSITGNGAFDSHTLRVDNVEALTAVGHSVTSATVRCSSIPPSLSLSHVTKEGIQTNEAVSSSHESGELHVPQTRLKSDPSDFIHATQSSNIVPSALKPNDDGLDHLGAEENASRKRALSDIEEKKSHSRSVLRTQWSRRMVEKSTANINYKPCSMDDVVVVHNDCIQDQDPEGAVCDNDNQPDEAYCSYDVDSSACAFCAAPTNVDTTIKINVRYIEETALWEWTLRDFEGNVVHSGSGEDDVSECHEEACIIDASECYSFTYSGDGVDFDVLYTWREKITIDGAELKNGLFIGQGCIKDACSWEPSLNPFRQRTQRNFDIMRELVRVSGREVFSSQGSPQYRAACWILHEDPLRTMVGDLSLMQRYVIRTILESSNGYQTYEVMNQYSNRHECQWNWKESDDSEFLWGFSCNEKQVITKIRHWEEGMQGSIPSEISQLPELVEIVLRLNLLSGSVPDEIYKLRFLRTLHLDSNNLNGTLSPNIKALSDLESLDVSVNLLSGNIPEEIFSLRSLYDINLFANRFTGTLSSNISKLSDLEYFQIQSNKLTGTLPPEMGNCSLLKELSLGRNKFAGQIPSTFQNLKEIQSLSMPNNLLQGRIPTEIGDMMNLQKLDLSVNLLSGGIPNEMGNIPRLDFLKLERNSLSGDIPPSICRNFQQLEKSHLSADCEPNDYSHVNCSCCNKCYGPFESRTINGRDCPIFDVVVVGSCLQGAPHRHPEGLVCANENQPTQAYCSYDISPTACAFCATPTIINGQPCRITDVVVSHTSCGHSIDPEGMVCANDGEINEAYCSYDIGPTYRACAFCADSAFQVNQICGKNVSKGVFDVLANVSGKKSLVSLYSSEYNASCWVINEAESKINPSERERYLLLQRYIVSLFFIENNGVNFLDNGHECNWHGMFCDKDKIIRRINLAGEGITGTLSRELGELKLLKVLNLENNNFVGGIPDEMAMWELEELYLGNNKFNGTISEVVELMGNIKVLDLHNNSLSGSIPPNLYHLINLEVLNITRNFFGGTIASSIGNLALLERLDLSFNFFTGVMPSDIFKASNLTELILSSNMFTGRVPLPFQESQIYTYPEQLSRLLLGDNEFGSSIPKTIEKLTGLKELAIDNNQLTGIIPTMLGKLMNLELMSLSYNELKGKVPTELKNLKNLSAVYLHGNQLSGNADVVYSPDVYITDCGFPSSSDELIECNDCTICCNSLEKCQRNIVSGFSPLQWTLIVFATCTGFFLMCGFFSALFSLRKKFLFSLDARELCGPDSVYHFVLCNSYIGHIIVFLTLFFQFYLFHRFLRASSFEDKESSDWVYGMRCPRNRSDCEDDDDTTWMGWFSLFILMSVYMLKDIVKGVKLVFKATRYSSIRCLVGGMILIAITVYAITTSYFYNKTIALSDTEIIVNSVILLFMTDIDEWIHRTIFYIFPRWLEKQAEEAELFSDELGDKAVPADQEGVSMKLQADDLFLENSKNESLITHARSDSLVEEGPSECLNSSQLHLVRRLTDMVESLQKEVDQISLKLNEIQSKGKKARGEHARASYAQIVRRDMGNSILVAASVDAPQTT